MKRTRSLCRVVVLVSTALALLAGSAIAAGLAGDLDATFDTDGVALLTTTDRPSFYAVAEQSDGKLVVIGRDSVPDNLDPGPIPGWKIRRVDTDGSLDTSFGTNGVVTLFGDHEDWRQDEPLDVAIGAGDRIYISGRVFGPASSGGRKKKKGGNGPIVGRVTVVCLEADGDLDTGFGGTGIVQRDFAENVSGPVPSSILVDGSGRIVVGGFAAMPYDIEVAGRGKNKTRIVQRDIERVFLLRYLTDGTLDPTFDSDGVVIDEGVVGGGTKQAERMQIRGLRLRADGRLLALVWSRPYDGGDGGSKAYQVRRYEADGTRAAGSVLAEEDADLRHVNTLAIDSQGRVLIGLNEWDGVDEVYHAYVARYLATGGLDTSFGDSGYRQLSLTTPGDVYVFYGSAVVAGDALRIGCVVTPDLLVPNSYDALVIGIDANGDLDPNWGTGGFGEVLLPTDLGAEGINELLIDGNGDSVAVGWRRDDGVSTNYAWIARWCGD